MGYLFSLTCFSYRIIKGVVSLVRMPPQSEFALRCYTSIFMIVHRAAQPALPFQFDKHLCRVFGAKMSQSNCHSHAHVTRALVSGGHIRLWVRPGSPQRLRAKLAGYWAPERRVVQRA